MPPVPPNLVVKGILSHQMQAKEPRAADTACRNHAQTLQPTAPVHRLLCLARLTPHQRLFTTRLQVPSAYPWACLHLVVGTACL